MKTGVRCHHVGSLQLRRSALFWTKENGPFLFSDPGCATSERFRNLGDEFFVGKHDIFMVLFQMVFSNKW